MNYGLNDEQLRAIQAPSPTLVNASAGSGKTRCIIAKIMSLLDAGVSPETICAITFTNKAANEMRARIKSQKGDIAKEMQMSTIHSMCVGIIKAFIKYTPLKYPFSIYDEGNQLSVIKSILKANDSDDSPYDVLSHISRLKSDNLSLDDFPEAVQYQRILEKNNAADFDDLLIYALKCLEHEDCRAYYSSKWTHFLVDEVQDTSEIQYKIVTSMYDPEKTKTLFFVGDKNQCVVSGSMIETESKPIDIKDIKEGDTILAGGGNKTLKSVVVSKKFRKHVRNLPVITVNTQSGFSLTSTYDHKHFANFLNTGPKKFFTYLMYREDLGYRVGVTSSVRRRNYTTQGYKVRMNQEKADAIWLLGVCDKEADARYYEQLYSIKYGIPTWVFFSKGRGLSLSYGDKHIKKLYKEMNTEKGALALLKDLGLFLEYPHHTPKCMSKDRYRTFTVYLCGSERRGVTSYESKTKGKRRYPTKNISHCFTLSGSDVGDEKKLQKIGLRTRKAKDRKGYRIDSVRANLSDVYSIVDQIEQVMPVKVIEKGRFSNQSLSIIPASHVMPGMSCFVRKGKEVVLDTVKSVSRGTYTGDIYDLNVDRVHNFIANGIVTHNSIYAWRGARPENMNKFINDFRPSICSLTYNYRSSPTIISQANEFLQFGKLMVSKSDTPGNVSLTAFNSMEDEARKIASAIQQMGDYNETAILYRVNSRSVNFERVLAEQHIPYHVIGSLEFFRRRVSRDLMAYLKAANNPHDIESVVRIVNVPKRGFGEAKKEKLFLEGRPYLQYVAEDMYPLQEFLNLLDSIKGKRPSEALEEVVASTGYRGTLKKESDISMLDTFMEISSGFETVEEFSLYSSFLEEDSGKGVKLMTAHASKGLEFNRVFVVGVEKDTWPHAMSNNVEEENRLFYVACTRARRYLNISYSRSRMFRGEEQALYPSPLFSKTYKYLHGKEMRGN